MTFVYIFPIADQTAGPNMLKFFSLFFPKKFLQGQRRLLQLVSYKNLYVKVGTSQARLMLGFMLTTMFLSMWISNTATTAMMLPIVDAVAEAINTKAEKVF